MLFKALRSFLRRFFQIVNRINSTKIITKMNCGIIWPIMIASQYGERSGFRFAELHSSIKAAVAVSSEVEIRRSINGLFRFRMY